MLLVNDGLYALRQYSVLQRQVFDLSPCNVRSVKGFLCLGRHAAEVYDLRLFGVFENFLLLLKLLIHSSVAISLFHVQKRAHQTDVIDCLAFNRILNDCIFSGFFFLLFFISLGGVHCLKHLFNVSSEFVDARIVIAFVIDLLDSVLASIELLVVAVLVTCAFDWRFHILSQAQTLYYRLGEVRPVGFQEIVRYVLI